jgi:formyltetrahydrofolate-dependent phosphoribosylglycinamide formyltransferase
MGSISYREAGVDMVAGDELVDRIKPFAKMTRIPEVLSDVGGFAGLCAVPEGIEKPVLVSGTDGVGTKLKVAFLTGVHDTIGQDLVAMCVNDIITTGARPLFFLDYFGTGKLDVGVAENVVKGIANACRESGCALLGGETAELPGMYAEGEYDLAGFTVGVVARAKIVDGKRVVEGDRVIGLASSGLHSNGYSLARRVLFDALKLEVADRPAQLGGKSVGEALLAPTRLYPRHVQAVLAAGIDVHAMSHITGGGLPGNLPRVLPDHLGVRLPAAAWKRPAIIDDGRARGGGRAPSRLQSRHRVRVRGARGSARTHERRAANARRRADRSRRSGPHARGHRVRGAGGLSVTVKPFTLGVLVSGSGTNLQAVIDAVASGRLAAKIGVVVSNVATAKGLDRARAASIPAIVVEHKAHPTREAFDAAVVEVLRGHDVSCVVLAGFMRIVTNVLLDAFPHRVVNIHPALLPAFPGVHAQAQALAYGVRVSGCTVHFVDAGMDTGPILAQAAVPVLDDDDETALRDRILVKEHELLPTVLQWIADGRVEVMPREEGARPRVRIHPVQ